MQHTGSAGPREAPLASTSDGRATRGGRVRGRALPSVASGALVASLLVAVGFALWPARIRQQALAPEPAALESFAREIEAIRAEVAERPPADAATQAAVARLAERIEAIAREIVALRSRGLQPPAAPPAPAAAPGDLGVARITERLDGVEARQSQAETERVEVVRRLLARLHDLEARQDERERRDGSALRLLLDRVAQLEQSRDVAEANRLTGQNAILGRLGALESRLDSVPAAPQP